MTKIVPVPEDRLIPTLDEFSAWAEHPVTRFVAAAWKVAAEAQRDAWMSTSWTQGKTDPLILAECRTRADAYSAFLETGLEDYAAILGVAPTEQPDQKQRHRQPGPYRRSPGASRSSD